MSVNTNKDIRLPKTIEDLTAVIRQAIHFSNKLEAEREREGWHGDEAHNIAISVARFIGLYGYDNR